MTAGKAFGVGLSLAVTLLASIIAAYEAHNASSLADKVQQQIANDERRFSNLAELRGVLDIAARDVARTRLDSEARWFGYPDHVDRARLDQELIGCRLAGTEIAIRLTPTDPVAKTFFSAVGAEQNVVLRAEQSKHTAAARADFKKYDGIARNAENAYFAAAEKDAGSKV